MKKWRLSDADVTLCGPSGRGALIIYVVPNRSFKRGCALRRRIVRLLNADDAKRAAKRKARKVRVDGSTPLLSGNAAMVNRAAGDRTYSVVEYKLVKAKRKARRK